MNYYFYPYIALIGGADGSLDSLDGSLLKDGDSAFVVNSSGYYIYYLDEDSNAIENSPYVISPDANAGTKRWILKNSDVNIIKSDQYATLQEAVTAAAGKTLIISGTHTITSAVSILSDTEIVGEPSCLVTTATSDISLFTATSKANIKIRGVNFEYTSVGSAAYVAGVHLDTCTDCVVENCEFDGMQWAGVWLDESVRCRVNGNYFHDFLGHAIQDGADVCVYEDAQYNIVENNTCNGGGWHGILVQDPYTTSEPLHNIIRNNFVGAHKAYGICIYQPNTMDTDCQIIGNQVEGILGSVLNNDAGAGIYVAGAGGCVIDANIVKNCCINTDTDRNLTPAGIGINGVDTYSPTVISNNQIIDVHVMDGINVASSSSSVLITGNMVSLESDNTTGIPIYINTSDNVTITGNNVSNANSAATARCILIDAAGASISNIVISGNIVKGGNYSNLEVIRSGAYTATGIIISGNSLTGGSSNGYPMLFTHQSSDRVIINGNYCSANTQPAIGQDDCTNFRYSNNILVSSGAIGFATSGTCTGSIMDKSNLVVDSGGAHIGTANAGTGCLIEFLASASPTSGTWAVGDRVEMNAPAVGQPKGWRCTVAGNYGTWVSEGNL